MTIQSCLASITRPVALPPDIRAPLCCTYEQLTPSRTSLSCPQSVLVPTPKCFNTEEPARMSSSDHFTSATGNDTFSGVSAPTAGLWKVLGADQILVKGNECAFSLFFRAA